MPWIIAENKLDPQQRTFIDSREYSSRNIWIKGFPGSGKSVLLAYTLKQIKSRNKDATVVVVVFTRALVEMFKEAFEEMGLDVEVKTYYEFMKLQKDYDYVLSDEVQDLVPSVLKAMMQSGKRVIVAGDENQSIYECDPKNNETTVSPAEIPVLLSAGHFELTIIHRLSSSIISAIQRLMPNMNIFSAKRDLTRASTQIRICSAKQTGEEVKYVMREAVKAVKIGETSAILLPKNSDIIAFANAALMAEGKCIWTPQQNRWRKTDYAALNSHLSSEGIRLKYVGGGVGDFKTDDHKVILMSYHSAKGLDFDNVFLPFMNSGLQISNEEMRSKTLFMVAMTRSRNNLYITYSGEKHPYLSLFSEQCSLIDIENALAFTTMPRNQNATNVFGI